MTHSVDGSAVGYTVIIPARYGSRRLPGKPLMDLCGKPMIQRVYECASRSSANRVIIATDDQRIERVATQFGAEVCLTRTEHPTGTDRLQEVCALYGLHDDEVVVNVQGDEPLMPAAVIDQVAGNLIRHPSCGAATLAEPIRCSDQLLNPNVVKVVTDRNGFAICFSRSALPWSRDGSLQSDYADLYRRHIGIYAYRVATLNEFVRWGSCPLESVESLEQLRLLWNGRKIHVADTVESLPAGVDTADDLEAVRRLVSQRLKDAVWEEMGEQG